GQRGVVADRRCQSITAQALVGGAQAATLLMQLQMDIRIQAVVSILSGHELGISRSGNHRGVVGGENQRGEVHRDTFLRKAFSKPIAQQAVASNTAGDENGSRATNIGSS